MKPSFNFYELLPAQLFIILGVASLRMGQLASGIWAFTSFAGSALFLIGALYSAHNVLFPRRRERIGQNSQD